ncbi:TetR/AcrR family transcriptional regulator [Jhaorihella thermophila]|uniref:DNA-binding transcriptional regulator, AcrR family n=1 Tax=Jhaorihella thermophila TaxID=488547 RepID=A0A1H5U2A0_9RHOB|nr:TetR/AcrR family transcriptional regulator [Jhaorihella thermophila]SEF68548.1 DNA-binding transcriptional regulator, AcrR family [Jhaorihella thermophila]
MARAAAYDRDTALQAAMVLFWRKGYHATSLKDLEAALNMKPGSIYAAFSSKETLYLLALKRYFETSRERFRERVAQSRSPLAALADNLRAYVRISPDDAARRVCMLTKTLVDTQATDPKIAAVTRDYLVQMRGEFAQAFRAARDVGELPPDADPDRLARRYQANVTALRFELHRGALRHEIEELAEDMAREVEALRP